MNSAVLNKTYEAPPFCEREILRYVGCKEADNELSNLMELCINEVKNKLTYKVCYCELPLRVDGNICDFKVFRLKSEKLAVNLRGCKRVLLFAATVGVEVDRLIAKYGRIAPSRALIFQAIGAERIEALCNAFCEDIAKERGMGIRPRFSPGYGDLSLAAQKDIFSVLDCSRRIGLSLNSSLLMSPSKSVTAFAGLCDIEENPTKNKCSACDKKDCSFRSIL